MDEAADIAASLPTFILLAFWWAFLAALSTMSDLNPNRPDKAKPTQASQDVASINPSPRTVPGQNADLDEHAFLSGAAKAYEIVLNAFAKGDIATLRPLLAPDVLAAFEDAIGGRGERQETMELSFIRLTDACIESTRADGNGLEITVRFTAEVISVTRSSTGDAVAGDPGRIVSTHDLWTFARKNRRADWCLVGTEEA